MRGTARLLTTALLVAATTTTGTQVAVAAPPVPLDPGPIAYEAGVACAFPVIETARGKAGSSEHRRFVLLTSPGARFTLTNTVHPERSTTVVSTSSAKSVVAGGVETVTAHGKSLFFDPGIGQTAVALTGTIVVTFSGDTVTLDTSRAKVVDLCALIA